MGYMILDKNKVVIPKLFTSGKTRLATSRDKLDNVCHEPTI
jgi:hypothetical protein